MRCALLMALLHLAGASSACQGQLATLTPGLQVVPRATALLGPGETVSELAVDRFGNTFLLMSMLTPQNSAIRWLRLVRADGSVVPTYALYSAWPTLGYFSQLATSPIDGLVYVAATSPGSQASPTVWRLDASLSAPVAVGTLPVAVGGFVIDPAGRFIVSMSAPGAPGLHLHDPNGPPGNLTLLLSLATPPGRLVRRADGALVYRGALYQMHQWFMGGGSPAAFFSFVPTLPNTNNTIMDFDATPFDAIGNGIVMAFRFISTPPCYSYSGLLAVGPYTAQPSVAALSVSATTCALVDVYAIGIGMEHDLYWIDSLGDLLRIVQSPGPATPGSLIASAIPGSLSLALQGPIAGSGPFLLGAVPQSLAAAAGAMAPGYGLVALSFLHPAYVPVFDGVGVFGAPNVTATTLAGSTWSTTLAVPASVAGTAVALQALTLSNTAPNGAFIISNVAGVTLL